MSTIARLTIEQYDLMIAGGVFDGPQQRRIELTEGELREMSPSGPRHDFLVAALNRWSMSVAASDSAEIRIQGALGLSDVDSVPEPDVLWLKPGDYWEARPSADDVLLLVEIAETSLAYDRGPKAMLYAEAKIPDYWIVSIEDRCVEVRRDPENGHYRSLQTFSLDDEVSPLAFPQATLKVGTLFPADSQNS